MPVNYCNLIFVKRGKFVQRHRVSTCQSLKFYMKKIYTLTVLLSSFAIAATAQFEKGQKLLGGSIGFSLRDLSQRPTQNFDYKSSSVSLKPSFGWFTKTNQLVGIAVEYSRSSTTQSNQPNNVVYKSYNNSAGASIFTQHFFPIVQRLYFTLKGSGGVNYLYEKNTNSSTGPSSESKNTGLEVKVALAPGLSYQVNKHFLFDLSLNDLVYAAYNRRVFKSVNPQVNDSKGVEQNFNLASSLNSNLSTVGLGFRWLIK